MSYKLHVTQNADQATAYITDVTVAQLVSDAVSETISAGAIAQLTDKSTGVTLNTMTGKITLNAANLAAAAIVSFTLTNSLITATDLLNPEHVSGGTAGAYTVTAFPDAGSAVISIRNNTAGGLAEAVVLRFKIARSANA